MLVHDRATPLARRRTPEGLLEMCARIGRAGLQDDRAVGATTSDVVAGLRAAIKMRDDEIAVLRAVPDQVGS